MITFKQKALFSAIAGAGALALTGAANAVYVNHDGLGQVLVYPYYTARDGVATLLSVVNTTNNAKIVKVRFLEGKNSQEVLDFNLFLSPFDVWTGAVLPAGQAAADLLPGYTAPGPLGGGMLVTGDRSCTNPKIPAVGAAFRNFQYSADTTVAANQAMDRSMEGYVEMIEMAEIVSTSSLWADVKHTKANSWTPSCALVSHASVSANAAAWLTGPRGGLFGAGTLLNASGGTNTGYDATALNDFWSSASSSQYTQPGSTLPSLNSADGLTSIVQNGSNVYITNWAASSSSLRGADAVSTVIMHSKVMNEYAHTDDGVVGTDWVMTMPTKRFYVFPAPVRRPFQTAWNGRTARDDFGVSDTDREEFISTSITTDDFLAFCRAPFAIGTSRHVASNGVATIVVSNSCALISELGDAALRWVEVGVQSIVGVAGRLEAAPGSARRERERHHQEPAHHETPTVAQSSCSRSVVPAAVSEVPTSTPSRLSRNRPNRKRAASVWNAT